MLRDASHQQVIEKFSFIYSLTLSGSVDSTQQQLTEEFTVERTAKFKPEDSIEPKSSSLVFAPAIASAIETEEQRTHSQNNSAEIVQFLPENSHNSPPQAKSNYLGKFLFIFSCGYLVFVCWWLFGDRSGQLLAMLTGKQQIFLSKSDAEFIDYAEKSLAAIERKQASQTKNDDSTAESQVVYVPVYTSTPKTPPLPQPITPAPAPPPPPSVVKIPAPPPLPAPTPIAEATPPETTAVATSVSKPTPQYTLIGILELGDQSAALFKVKGATKRIWLGEEIDRSGWILESVANQTAKISYQGKIRSLSVGETF